MTRFSRRNAGILKIKIRPCLWFKENLGGIWQHLSTYWTSDPQRAADLRPSWGWRPYQCNSDGCFTNLSVQRCKCLLCLLTEDITARTSTKKLRFEKRFFLGIFKSKFLQHALSVDHEIDRLICDDMTQKQAFMHANPFLRVASVVVNHCVQIPKFLGRVFGNNVLLSIGKKNVTYWSQLASDYLTIIILGMVQLSGEKDLCQQGSTKLTNVPTRA